MLLTYTEKTINRFIDKIFIDKKGCWIWTDVPNSGGYGTFSAERKHFLSHRFSYEVFKGPIPKGYQVHHQCYERRCVKPEHLEVMTRRENLMDEGSSTIIKDKAKQTHCINGHEFNEKNTRIRSNGCRQCRACDRERKRKKCLQT
jgi:hypothetical protein